MNPQRQYELVYIVSPEIGEPELVDLHGQVEAIVARFEGRIERTENWGRRRLAYEIGRHKEGTYVLEVINGPGEMVRELDRRLRVLDTIIRHLVVRVDEEIRIADRAKARRTEGQQRRKSARAATGETPIPAAPAGAEDAPAGEKGAES